MVFGTHNQESCDLIVDCLKAEGLTEAGDTKGTIRLREDVQGKVFVAQLYGESLPSALYLGYGRSAE